MKRARAVTLLGLLGALLVTAALVVQAWDLILAEWHLLGLKSRDASRRERAAERLGALRSRKAVPFLIEAAGAKAVTEDAAGAALARIGAPAVRPLVEALADPRRHLRCVAVQSLMAIQPARYAPIADHLRGLVEPAPMTLWVHAGALAEMSRPSEEVVALLIGTLRDGEAQFRVNAAGALGKIGRSARAAIPALIEALETDPRTRVAAAAALGRMGPAAREAIPRLLEELRRGSPEAGEAALRALAAAGPGDERVLSATVEAFRAGDGKLRGGAASILPRFGRRAVRPLLELLADDPREERWLLAEALGRIGSRAEEAVPALVRLLQDQEPSLLRSAARALGGIGPQAAAAVPALLSALESEDDDETASDILQTLGEIGPETVPSLRGLLRGEDLDLRRSAATNLAAMGKAARPALPELIEALEDEDKWVQHHSVRALRNLGPEAEEALPALLRLLAEGEPEVAGAAAEALLGLDREGTAAPALLLDRLQNRSPWWVWGECAGAFLARFPELKPEARALPAMLEDERSRLLGLQCVLGGIPEETAAQVLPFLIRHARDRGSPLRWGCLHALKKLGLKARPAVPALLELVAAEGQEPLMGDPPEFVLLAVLANAGGPTKAVLAVLRAASGSDNLAYAMAASQWLWRWGELGDEPLIDLLLRVLRVHASEIFMRQSGYFRLARLQAAQHLGELGPRARSAVPWMLDVLEDPEPAFRARVAVALWKAAGRERLELVLETIVGALGDRPVEPLMEPEPEAVARCLGEVGPSALPFILPRLADEDERVRLGLLRALAQMGPAALPARAALLERLRDPHFRVRELAAEALRRIGAADLELPASAQARFADAREVERLRPESAETVPQLIAALGAESPVERRRAARALGKRAPADPSGVLALAGLLKDSDLEVRQATARALGAAGPSARATVEPLIEALGDPNRGVRALAARALGRLGLVSRPQVAALARALEDPHHRVREAAAGALKDLGPGAEEAIPALVHAVGREDRAADEAKGAIARFGAKAVPAVIEALKSENVRIKDWALDALGEIGPPASEAIPLVESFLAVPGYLERRAQEALEKIRLPTLIERTTPAGVTSAP